MKQNMLRRALILLAALLFSAALAVLVFSAAVFLKGGGIDALAAEGSASADAIVECALAGEDPALVEKLESIPEFRAAEATYVEGLLRWRYRNGPDWEPLSEAESEKISRALLSASVEAETPELVGDAESDGYAEVVDSLSAALKNPMRDVFPPYASVAAGDLGRELDAAAPLLSGSVFMGALVVTLALLCALLLLCGDSTNGFVCLFCGFLFGACLTAVLLFITGRQNLLLKLFPHAFLVMPSLTAAAPLLKIGIIVLLGGALAFFLLATRRTRDAAKEERPEAVPMPAAVPAEAPAPVFAAAGEEMEIAMPIFAAPAAAEEDAALMTEETAPAAPQPIQPAAPAVPAAPQPIRPAAPAVPAAPQPIQPAAPAVPAAPQPIQPAAPAAPAVPQPVQTGTKPKPSAVAAAAKQPIKPTVAAAPTDKALGADADFDDGNFLEGLEHLFNI